MAQPQLLSYQEFSDLRLSQFLPDDELQREVVPLTNWAFMGGTWKGHAIGFTEFLCLETPPSGLGSIAIDAQGLPKQVVSAILAKLRLPISLGMSAETLESIVGEPSRKHSFVSDRVSYEYTIGSSEPYRLGLTILREGGLAYIVVTRKDILALSSADA